MGVFTGTRSHKLGKKVINEVIIFRCISICLRNESSTKVPWYQVPVVLVNMVLRGPGTLVPGTWYLVPWNRYWRAWIEIYKQAWNVSIMSSFELYFDDRLAFHKTICRKLSTTMISKWRLSHRRLKGNDWWMDDPFLILIVHTNTLYTPNVPEIDQRNKSLFVVLNIYYSLLDIKHSYRSGGDTETWNLFVPSPRVGPWFYSLQL